MLDDLQASSKSETIGSTSTGGSDNSGVGVMGGRSFGDYDLADMTTATPNNNFPPYNYLDNDSSAGGNNTRDNDRNLDLDLDNSSNGSGSGSGGGLKASDFVFPSDLANNPVPGPFSSTSTTTSTSDISSDSSGSSSVSNSVSSTVSSPPNTAGMTKFQLQMSGQWNQQGGGGTATYLLD